MLGFLYNLLIEPIELLIEIIYDVMEGLLGSCGLAIIVVSLIIQTVILPLYKRSDAIQEEERQKQKDMSYWVKHIRTTFKGDERLMMLSAYYRQQNYKPWYALRSSFSILLQIPFFIAAYHYLSNLSVLEGQSFLFIKDLSRPDQIFMINTLPVNVLPIMMTVFNIISGVIYTHGLGKREKIQVYGLAAFFLIFLYNSPSGLVLYWTINNLYSLLKNILMKLLTGKGKALPFKFSRLRKAVDTGYERLHGTAFRLYVLEAVFLVAFIGGVIPLNVVNASPAEFMNDNYGPINIVIRNITVYAGIFLVWGIIFVMMMKPRAQYIFSAVLFVLSGIAILDYMGFGNSFGRMSPLLKYDVYPAFNGKEKLINAGLICVLIVVLVWLIWKHGTAAKWILRVLAMGTCIMCVVSTVSLALQVKTIMERQVSNGNWNGQILHLSRNGNNVIVIMLDRAISGYIPYIFEEKPELKEAFGGFSYYPNTLSFGKNTVFGAPAVFGGYEYTPAEINSRSDEKLADKHNEALLMMPRIFAEEGYDVTVCDPPYAGSYEWTPDLSIYDGYENISAYITEGRYSFKYFGEFFPSYRDKQESNFFYFSLMKVVPVVLQEHFYRGGEYFFQIQVSTADTFIGWYTVLLELSNLTEFSEGDENNFICIQNSTTHDVSLLRTPEYVPDISIAASDGEASYKFEERYVDGKELRIDNQSQAEHYQSNMAAIIALADWFEQIKRAGCWDNTKIILVSDHGAGLGNFDYMLFDNGLDIEAVNPLLMVKDYNSEGFHVSDEFMTNADVPSLAFEAAVDNPINPYTGRPINAKAKEKPQLMTTSDNWKTTKQNDSTFDTSDGEWYAVKENIFNESNWVLIEGEKNSNEED